MTSFTTLTGSTYVVSDDQKHITRYPSSDGAALDRDGERAGLLYLGDIEVGRSVVMWLDILRPSGCQTERITSSVTEVTE